MAKTYEEFVTLADAGRPHDENGVPTAEEGDYGSDRQVDAQNLFFDELEKIVPKDEFEELEGYCLKATTDEMIDEGLRILRNHMTPASTPTR